LDRRGVLASAHEVAARAAADEQIDRLDEHGFSGAGFAGEDVQPRFELDLETLDHRQMSHAEKAEHVETGTLMLSNF
jgi:hypothetical protein